MELSRWVLGGLTIVALVVNSTNVEGQDGEVVKGGYWFPDSGIPASAINSTLFTHLFCAFAQLDPNSGRLSIPPECASFPTTVRLKNPSVITLLSIGGGNIPSSDFNKMATNSTSRRTFINSSISLARSNGYDGLDLDWENQITSAEMNNLATLLNQWRTAVNAEATQTGADYALILTAALGVTPQVNPSARFPTQVIANTLDWVNVMAYDIYAPDRSNGVTRPPAPLNDPAGGVSGSRGIDAWIRDGVPAPQLVLGFPFYGYAWKLGDSRKNGILAPSTGYDNSVGTPDQGIPNYTQIKQFIQQKTARKMYNSTYVTNYCYSGTTWIGYDDIDSISAKVLYAKNKGLFGYFAWHVAADNNWTLSRQAFQAWI